MPDRENRCRRSVVLIVTCLLHGAIIFLLIHVRTENKSRIATEQPLTLFLLRPQTAIAIARPKQYRIERRSRKGQRYRPDSETPLPGISAPPVDSRTSEDSRNIDWAGEAQRSAEEIASRSASGSSNSAAAAAGSAPWNSHPGRLESTPEGLKLRITDLCFALLQNWTHDPLLGAKGELQLNCNWEKPPARGDLFDPIRRPPSNK